MNVLLISTYELGHQPFGLASPAASLRAAGADVVCLDLAVQPLDRQAVVDAALVAFYLPMHTATRIAAPLIAQVREINPAARICCYGLYAPVNEAFLRSQGADTILGGEFEQGLVSLYGRLIADGARGPQTEPRISLARQRFVVPDRRGLPELGAYAWLQLGAGERRTVGYTEASRGCKHLCRHCPVVPVYGGRFRVVQREVVLADIERQVAAGASHITFGDPDFFNGPGHAIPLVQDLHAAFPELTYDVTIKIEHLLEQRAALPLLRDTGCLFVTSAVEAVDDAILGIFDKRHTRADFIHAVALLRESGLTLNPTFVAFTPWTSRQGYRDLLGLIAELDLVANMAPIQYAIRLLIPAGSRLLELPSVQDLVGPFDQQALCYRWQHPEPQMDELQQTALAVVQAGQRGSDSRQAIFNAIWKLAHQPHSQPAPYLDLSRAPIPHMSEPWYC